MRLFKSNLRFIKNQIRLVYANLSYDLKEIAADSFVDFNASFKTNQFKAAYLAAVKIYSLAQKPPAELKTLFHNLIFAEDVITKDSLVLIHQESPYLPFLESLSKKLDFSIQTHDLVKSHWSKDYLISNGMNIYTPIIEKREEYFTSEHLAQAKNNPALYYGSLNLDAHHEFKVTVKSSKLWHKNSRPLIYYPRVLKRSPIEGGNFFCAINKKGIRYFLIGENVLSEVMAFNKMDRACATNLIAKELDCSAKKLLFIPQWTYHLDLQMAYLGRSQFIIHSFDQKNIDFGLSSGVKNRCNITFHHLHQLFEKNVIDATSTLLVQHGFDVKKVFGCLFYLDDCMDPEQLKYVPYCKSSDDFDGVLASMMNGIAMDLEENGRHFLATRCDIKPFKKQFIESIIPLGISQVHSADMLDAYDASGYFEGMCVGAYRASNVAEAAAFMNGALRCQTSIMSKRLSPVHNSEEKEQAKMELFDGSLPSGKKHVKVKTKPTKRKKPHQVKLDLDDSEILKHANDKVIAKPKRQVIASERKMFTQSNEGQENNPDLYKVSSSSANSTFFKPQSTIHSETQYNSVSLKL